MSSQGHEELTIHPPKGDSRSLQRPAIFSYHGQTLFRDCRLMLSILPKQPIGPIRFCFQSIKFTFLYLIPVVSAGLFVHFQWQRRSFPCESTFPCACFRFRSPPAVLSALFCPPAAPHLLCGCRRRCRGFPSAPSVPWVAPGCSVLSDKSDVLSHRMERKQQNFVLLTCRFFLRFLQIQLSTACWRNSFSPYQRYEIFNTLAINLLGAF